MKIKIYILLAALFAIVNGAFAENTLTAGNVTGNAGSTVDLPINITNDEIIAACQFDITLPKGVTCDSTSTMTARANGIEGSCSLKEGKYYTFCATPKPGVRYEGSEGTVYYLTLQIDESVAEGDYTIEISNALLSNSDGSKDIRVASSKATLSVLKAMEIEDFQFYAKDVVVAEGKTTATLEIGLKNSLDAWAMAFDLVLPEGVEIEQTGSGRNKTYSVNKGERFPSSEAKPIVTSSNGVYTIKVESFNSESIAAGDGNILSIGLKINEDAKTGFGIVKLSNQYAEDEEYNGFEASPFTSTLKINGTENITLTVNEGKWATLILPYAAETPAGLTAYTATGVNEGYVVLEEQSSIPATTPVIIYGAPGSYTFSGTNTGAKRNQYTTGILNGTLVSKDYAEGYVMQTQNGVTSFYRIGSAAINVPAYRCVLLPGQNNSVRRFILGNPDATAIEDIQALPANSDIFTLDGKKVSRMVKGNVYVIGETKVFIK